MIPFGPWRPDAAGINSAAVIEAKGCVPSDNGFAPIKSAVGATDALPAACVGAAVVLGDNGTATHYAGTTSQLYKLGAVGSWSAIGAGGYAVPQGDLWKFTTFGGSNVIAANIVSKLQLSSSGGSFANITAAPKARYVATVRDFVFAGSLENYEARVQWSAIGDVTGWTPGTNQSDYQDARSGGPVKGMIGGETGYVFQQQSVTRMTFVPGSSEVFQFDEVEGARGLVAPHSLVRIGRTAFYLAQDGLYEFDVGAGSSQPIGIGRWARFLANDIRPGGEALMMASADPISKRVMFAYVSRDNSSTTLPDRALIYDRTLQDAAIVDLSLECLVQWITQGVTIDTMNSYGTLDTLPFSLDSSFWRGGAGLLGIFDTGHKLASFQGVNMAAQWTTTDGFKGSSVLVSGVTPHIDATTATVAIAARERDGDAIIYAAAESMEDTGSVSAWSAGKYLRARIAVPTGAQWTAFKGIETRTEHGGDR